MPSVTFWTRLPCGRAQGSTVGRMVAFWPCMHQGLPPRAWEVVFVVLGVWHGAWCALACLAGLCAVAAGRGAGPLRKRGVTRDTPPTWLEPSAMTTSEVA